MELVLLSAVRVQLSTLPVAELEATLSKLRQLAGNPDQMGHEARRVRSDPDLWMVHLSGRLRALVRIQGNQLQVLAVAPLDQLTPYLERDGKRVA